MIQHSVVFTLKHEKGSAEESDFLRVARTLADIPGVKNFKCLRQISPKNHYSFGHFHGVW